MIVSGGENVFPLEVADVLARHEAVADVAVFGVEDEQFGQRLRAYVVAAGETSPPRTSSRTTSARTSSATRSRATSSSSTRSRATRRARSCAASSRTSRLPGGSGSLRAYRAPTTPTPCTARRNAPEPRGRD